jgi:SAM-dependent methyltransferase
MFAPGAGFTSRYQAIASGTILQMLDAIEQNGGNIRTMSAVLDFGCGTGRLIRHFRSIGGLMLAGCDLNLQMVDWCRSNLGGIEFKKNDIEPPLPYADAAFDLVYSYSVFTHIPARLQPSWAEEMNRVTRPGGFVIATVSGSWLQGTFLSEDEKKYVEEHGYLEFTSTDSRASLATQLGGSGWDVYQTKAGIIDVFRPYFEIKDYLPGFQDIIVLRHPAT